MTTATSFSSNDQQKLTVVVQLATRLARAVCAGSQRGNLFATLHSLIWNVISKLLKEGEADATETLSAASGADGSDSDVFEVVEYHLAKDLPTEETARSDAIAVYQKADEDA